MMHRTALPSPPVAKRVQTRREHHGDVFVDPYEWLRDKDSPEVIAYLEAENDYTERTTAHLEPLRQKIFHEIKARTKETDLSVPTRRGNWWYYARTFEGKAVWRTLSLSGNRSRRLEPTRVRRAHRNTR